MTKLEICELLKIEDPIFFFELEDLFNKGIIGVSEDNKHVIYGCYKLADALAEYYKQEDSDSKSERDYYSEAWDYIDSNVIPTADRLAVKEENFPIVICELNN